MDDLQVKLQVLGTDEKPAKCRSVGTSPSIQSFWVGKSLLLTSDYKKNHFNNDKSTKRINELQHEMEVLRSACIHETCLSPNVYRMISKRRTPLATNVVYGKSEKVVRLFSDTETLNWDVVGRLLGEDISEASFDYERTANNLWAISKFVHQALTSTPVDEFEQKFSSKLNWTGNRETFLDCFSLIHSGDALAAQVAMLLMSSLLERALGDLYMTVANTSQCPSLLKDLLSTSELKKLFGNTAITCLHVLIGPPCGLNLRNILWHGFIAPGEISVEFASLLLHLVCSLSDALSCSPLPIAPDIKRRPPVTCPGLSLITSTFPMLSQHDIPAVENLFASSFFIIPTMLPIWLKALDYYVHGRFDYTVVLLLPQLEQGLRRVFACVNNCPERVLTAESTVLYTTFEQILSPTLEDGIAANALRKEIGDTRVELLLDLLVHAEGPRVRDHISHGELELVIIPKELASYIICVCVSFAALYQLKSGKDQERTEVVTEIMSRANNYESIFHPIAVLRRKTRELVDSLSKWRYFPKPEDEEFAELAVYNEWDSSPVTREVFQTICSVLTLHLHTNCLGANSPLVTSKIEDVLKLVKNVLDRHLSTLYCPKSQLELVGLLRNIVQCCNTIAQQFGNVCQTRHKQWSRKELRSRQRLNYKRLWSHLPLMESVLHVTLVVVIIEISQLASTAARTPEQHTKHVKFLRRCLTCTENLESLSSPTKNRWDECASIGAKLLRITTEKLKSII